MPDEQLREHYRDLLAARPGQGRNECPPPEALLALVERDGSRTGREASLRHVMGCADCLREFELLRVMAGARPQRAGIGRAAMLALAAGLTIVIGLGTVWRLQHRTPASDPERGGGETMALAYPPADFSGSPGRFVWHAIPGASAYRFALVTAEGDTRYAMLTTDTVVMLPDSLLLEPGALYLWEVQGTLLSGEVVTSTSRRIRFRRP